MQAFPLRETFGDRYRITRDESASIEGQTNEDRAWLWQIPCKYGHIFIAGPERIGAYCNRRLVIGRLLAIPGVRVDQRGDHEVNVSFDPAIFTQIADLLQARKRKVFREESLARFRDQIDKVNAKRREGTG